MANLSAQAARPARVAQPRPRPQQRPAPRPRRPAPRNPAPARVLLGRPRLAGGVLWIAAVAGLLAGIVALNVAVLRLNVQVDELERKREALLARQAEAASELSSAAATGRIESLARRRLGLAPPAETVYVRVPRPPR